MSHVELDIETATGGKRVELPDGYEYANAAATGMAELRALDESIHGPFESGLDRASWPTVGRDIYGNFHIHVGVRNPEDDELVGIGLLSLGWQQYSGKLTHLMIRNQHRHRGLGRAILLERVRIADELGVSQLRTELGSINTLAPLYRDLGFIESDRAEIVRKIPL